MLGEQYRAIQELRKIAEEQRVKEQTRQKLALQSPDAEATQQGATRIIHEIFEDCLGNDSEITKFPNRRIDVKNRPTDEGREIVFYAMYGNKFGLTEEDKALLVQYQRVIPGVPEQEVPPYIIAKDYFRTPRVAVTPATVTFTYKPRTVDVYLPGQTMVATLGEETYPTLAVLQNKSILYPAVGRLMEDVTHVQETMYRGVYYWRTR